MGRTRISNKQNFKNESFTDRFYSLKVKIIDKSQTENKSHLGPIHTSYCCRAKPIIIKCGTSTAFFMFDSYVEPNLSNLITNQAKIAFVSGKMTGALNEELSETSY